MKNLKLNFAIIAFIFSLLFVSCESEHNDELALNPSIEYNIKQADLLSFSTNYGTIGKLITNDYNGKPYTINGLNSISDTNAKFLYIDIDNMISLGTDYSDLLQWSLDNKIGLLFESASNNTEKMLEFTAQNLGSKKVDFNIEALIVNPDENEEMLEFIAVNNEHSMKSNDVITIFFEDLYEAKHPIVETPTEETIKVKDGEVTLVEAANRTYTYNVTFKNISLEEAKKKAEAIVKSKVAAPTFKGHSDFKYNMKPNVYAKGARKTHWIREGSLHNATGKCKNQQAASYGEDYSYSKEWSTTLDASFEIFGSFTFGGSVSYGGSKTKGKMNSSDFYMRRQYARGGVASYNKYCKGYLKGTTTFTSKVSGRRKTAYLNVKVVIDDNSGKWEGWRIQSAPFFKWNSWGAWLKDCN